MKQTCLQRPLAQADAACLVDTVLARSTVRPLIKSRCRSGSIRRILSLAAIFCVAALALHVVIADPLGRTFRDIERASIEYCGQC